MPTYLEQASILDNLATLGVVLLGILLDERPILLKVRPVLVFSVLDVSLHQRHGCGFRNDAVVVGIIFPAGEIFKVLGHEIASAVAVSQMNMWGWKPAWLLLIGVGEHVIEYFKHGLLQGTGSALRRPHGPAWCWLRAIFILRVVHRRRGCRSIQVVALDELSQAKGVAVDLALGFVVNRSVVAHEEYIIFESVEARILVPVEFCLTRVSILLRRTALGSAHLDFVQRYGSGDFGVVVWVHFLELESALASMGKEPGPTVPCWAILQSAGVCFGS